MKIQRNIIMKKTNTLMDYGTKVENVIMGLGIGMQRKFYEVGIEFYEKFSDKFGKETEFIKKSFYII
mgnify:CR=1 FL=1